MAPEMDRASRIAWAASLACLMEVSSEKPGNVTPTHDFADTRYTDFVLSALAIGPVLAKAGEWPVGELVHRGVQHTWEAVRVNTNLGILLLLAPIARAYAAGAELPATDGALRRALAGVLADLDLGDAEAAFAAIRMANPGGLGSAEHDVGEAPRVSLREAMASAADRDAVAREYVTDFDLTCSVGLPALREALRSGQEIRQAVLSCFLALLSAWPDSLVRRKLGPEAAEQLRCKAAAVRELGGIMTPEGRAALGALERRLRDPQNRHNPGTTADLTAAALFWLLLLEGIEPLRAARS